MYRKFYFTRISFRESTICICNLYWLKKKPLINQKKGKTPCPIQEHLNVGERVSREVIALGNRKRRKQKREDVNPT